MTIKNLHIKLDIIFDKYRNYLPFLSFILLSVSFRFYYLGWLSFIAIVPLLIFLQKANKKNYSTKKLFLIIYSASLIFWIFISSWIVGVKPQLWAGVNGNIVTLLVYITWVLVIFSWSASTALISILVSRKAFDIRKLKHSMLILPAWWALSFYISSWLFSLIVYGKDATIGPFWNFGNLGFQIIDTPLKYTIRFIGLYGALALVVLINVGFYQLWLKKYKPIVYILGIASVISLVSFLIYSPNGKNIKIAAMQVNSNDRGKYIQKINNIVKNNQNISQLDLMVIPEGVSFYDQFQSALYANTITKKALNGNGITVAGGEAPRDNFKSERILYRNNKGDVIDEQEKNFLIPGGEYSPYELNFMFNLFGKSNIRSQYQLVRVVKKGRQKEHPFLYNDISFGTLSCSGIIAPQTYQEMSKAGANILVDTAELDILRDSPNFFNQTRQTAKFMAISNAKPFVQGTFGGYSYIFNSNGNTVKSTTNFDTTLIYGYVKLSSKSTLYSALGEIFIPISIVYLAFVALGIHRKTKN